MNLINQYKLSVRRSIIVICILIQLIIFPIQQINAKERTKQNVNKFMTPSGIADSELERELDSIFDQYIDKEVEGAAIVLAKDGEIVFEKGYGYADESNKVMVDPKNTVFEYGSVTKLFTWVSAMQLEEEKKLDLNKDIQEYLPDGFDIHTSYKKPITMLNLMNHTAGYDDYLIGVFTREDNYTNLRTSLEENKVSQVNEPGCICSYSNFGTGLAGYIVECVAKKPTYQYVRENIFNRLSLENITQSIHEDATPFLIKHKSKGYEYNEKNSLCEARWTYIPMYPAGEGNGTVEELAKFGIGLLDKDSGLFLDSNTYDELFTTTYTVNKDVTGVAHGFFEFDGESKAYWHNGETDNFHTFFAVVPEKKFVVAVVANTSGEAADELVHTVGRKMIQKKQIKLYDSEKHLPDARKVCGSYSAPRCVHHGISQLLYISSTSDITVDYVGKNKVTINGEAYQQVKPYLYQNMENGQMSYFTTENGKVTKYTYLQGYQKNTWTNTVRYIGSYVVMIIFVITLVSMIAYAIAMLVNRRTRENKTIFISVFLWLLLCVSIVFITVSALDGARFNEIRPYILVNDAIAIGLIINYIIELRTIKKITSKCKKIYYLLCSISGLLMLIILGMWGVFNPYR